MNSDNFVIMVILALGFGVFGYLLGADAREKEAIAREYALHCPVTGDFSWKDEC